MTKYRYFYVIQQSVSPTIWKDICELDEGIGKADALIRLMDTQDGEGKYRIIKRRSIKV